MGERKWRKEADCHCIPVLESRYAKCDKSHGHTTPPPLIMNAIGMTYRRTRTYCRTVRSNPLPVSFSQHYTRLVLRWKETPLCDLAGQHGIPLARVTHMHHQPRNSLSPMATRMHGDPQDREARREECRAPPATILCRSPVLHLRPSCEDDCNAAPRPPVDSDVGDGGPEHSIEQQRA